MNGKLTSREWWILKQCIKGFVRDYGKSPAQRSGKTKLEFVDFVIDRTIAFNKFTETIPIKHFLTGHAKTFNKGLYPHQKRWFKAMRKECIEEGLLFYNGDYKKPIYYLNIPEMASRYLGSFFQIFENLTTEGLQEAATLMEKVNDSWDEMLLQRVCLFQRRRKIGLSKMKGLIDAKAEDIPEMARKITGDAKKRIKKKDQEKAAMGVFGVRGLWGVFVAECEVNKIRWGTGPIGNMTNAMTGETKRNKGRVYGKAKNFIMKMNTTETNPYDVITEVVQYWPDIAGALTDRYKNPISKPSNFIDFEFVLDYIDVIIEKIEWRKAWEANRPAEEKVIRIADIMKKEDYI